MGEILFSGVFQFDWGGQKVRPCLFGIGVEKEGKKKGKEGEKEGKRRRKEEKGVMASLITALLGKYFTFFFKNFQKDDLQIDIFGGKGRKK